MHPDEKLLQDIIDRIVAVAQPEQIILFGSAARGEMGRNSDIDLLVVKSGVHRRRLTAEIYRHMIGAGYPVDVVVVWPEDLARYRDSPALLLGEAVRNGTMLYATSGP